ncbi:MAG: cyclic pyranopterin monophosphate synthase MoaC [Planctomycetaceae bacterium]|nr:MAG: cyclic pyranopterin monophosphate synthase MoaC [Planctomycetaceae bacterium]
MPSLTHFDDSGASRMVDVSDKPVTQRVARAGGRVTVAASTLLAIFDRKISKGDVLEVARLAGIMAAKETSRLIPLCHVLPLSGVTVDFSRIDGQTVGIEAEVRVEGRTGVEMEALTAVTVAALTIYDMCKSIDRGMTLGPFLLLAKSGGQSGAYERRESTA